MTTAYTSLLGLALPVTGELSGTWGDTVNNSITSLLDSAIAGTTTLSTDVDVTLTTTTGAANTAREAILLCSGARTGIKTITAPAQSKIYTIINATTGGYAVKIVGAGPTTGLTIPNGSSAVIAWNGSDFIEIGSGTIGSLTVNGNLTVTGTSTLTGAITNTAATANGVMYANGSKVLTTGSALVFDGTNLGIGVTPTQLIEGTAANPRLKLNATSTGYSTSQFANTSGSSYFGRDSSTAGFFGIANGTVIYSSTSDPIGFFLAGSEQMRLTSTGLGIGTSSPSYKLDVSGQNSRLNNSGSTAITYFDVSNSYGTTRLGTDGSGNGYVGTASAIPLALYVGNGIKATLDTSGNLGLGVTPSAWFASNKAFQIGSTGCLSNYTNGANIQTFLANNVYWNAAGTISYLTTNTATSYTQDNGTHKWYYAPSGTAGNAITFTQAMTLDASGNLLVGQTSANSFNLTSGFGFDVRNPYGLGVAVQSNPCAIFNRNTTTGTIVDIRYNATTVGSISYNGSLTLYNATSDYRLKTVVGAVSGSGERIDALEPIEYTWNSNGQRTRGFLAHKFQEVYADSVTGTKDAVDANGKPVYQGMQASSSEVIADLVAEIQSLRKRLATAGI